MKIQITRVSWGYWGRGRHGYSRGVVVANVDGHSVMLREGRGWTCYCPATECEHVDAVAQLIDPKTIGYINTPVDRPRPKTEELA